MSADGYFRIPRRLATAQISPERVAALLWIVSQASYAPRDAGGIPLDVGETPPIAASEFEKRYRWTRKAVRVFLDYAVSERCAEETGIRIRVGKKSKGPSQGPRVGPSQGPTYVVRLHRLATDEGPALGPWLGPSKGPSEKKEEGLKKGSNSLPTGEKQPKRARGSRWVCAGWEPTAEQEANLRSIAVQRGADYGEQMAMLRDHEFPRPYTEPYKVALNWMRKASPSLNGRANGNGRNGTGRGRGEDWRYRREGESARDDPIFAEDDT